MVGRRCFRRNARVGFVRFASGTNLLPFRVNVSSESAVVGLRQASKTRTVSVKTGIRIAQGSSLARTREG
jgi:hypothetical protein